ncbi:MAG: very short patch repair endonuclease [Egibacteraceae bacterium]
MPEATRRDPAVTSRMMAAVRNKDSKAELALRRALHARGVRYRLHAKDVIGRPDLVIRKYRLAIFVDGDFWHGNAWRLRGLRRLEDLFPTNTEFWAAKIRRNMARDAEVTEVLQNDGWTVVRVWESDVRTDLEQTVGDVLDVIQAARRQAPKGSEATTQ